MSISGSAWLMQVRPCKNNCCQPESTSVRQPSRKEAAGVQPFNRRAGVGVTKVSLANNSKTNISIWDK
eukprot:656608-Pelagomonas_calceolata.AAC.3